MKTIDEREMQKKTKEKQVSSPVLANIFIGFHESRWLNEYNLCKPKFYLRYVHGILAASDNEQDSLNFLKFF